MRASAGIFIASEGRGSGALKYKLTGNGTLFVHLCGFIQMERNMK
jgi:hypothetical protein